MPNNYVLSVYKLFSNNKIKFYKHNKISDADFDFLVNNMRGVMKEIASDKAHVLASTDTAIAYKIGDFVYFIPAKIKAVVFNGESFETYYDYPCEMKREDLIEL